MAQNASEHTLDDLLHEADSYFFGFEFGVTNIDDTDRHIMITPPRSPFANPHQLPVPPESDNLINARPQAESTTEFVAPVATDSNCVPSESTSASCSGTRFAPCVESDAAGVPQYTRGAIERPIATPERQFDAEDAFVGEAVTAGGRDQGCLRPLPFGNQSPYQKPGQTPCSVPAAESVSNDESILAESDRAQSIAHETVVERGSSPKLEHYSSQASLIADQVGDSSSSIASTIKQPPHTPEIMSRRDRKRKRKALGSDASRSDEVQRPVRVNKFHSRSSSGLLVNPVGKQYSLDFHILDWAL